MIILALLFVESLVYPFFGDSVPTPVRVLVKTIISPDLISVFIIYAAWIDRKELRTLRHEIRPEVEAEIGDHRGTM